MGQAVWIPVGGRSMEPLLREGDEVLVQPLDAWPPESGAIVLFTDAAGRFVMHRVWACDWFECTTHGLANALPDRPVQRRAVLGVAIRRRRDASDQGVRLPHLSAAAAVVLGWAVRVQRWSLARW